MTDAEIDALVEELPDDLLREIVADTDWQNRDVGRYRPLDLRTRLAREVIELRSELHGIDRNEPLTDDWLLSIGCQFVGSDLAISFDLEYDCHSFDLFRDAECGQWQVRNSVDENNQYTSVPNPQNHGEFLDLCRALKIPTKGPS